TIACHSRPAPSRGRLGAGRLYLTRVRNAMELALEVWRERLERRPPVHEMVTCDNLTQVASCEFGLHRLDEEVKRAIRYNHALSCLVVDIDGFSAVNGEHGEARVDRILQDVATIVSHTVRSTDVVARLEGFQLLIYSQC